MTNMICHNTVTTITTNNQDTKFLIFAVNYVKFFTTYFISSTYTFLTFIYVSD